MNSNQKKIDQILKNAKDGELINYYGIWTEKLNVRAELGQLDKVSDQIALLQMANDYEFASKLIDSGLTNEKQREMYNRLKENNSELDETINIELLSDRYAFLGDLLEGVVTDIEVQQRLISLSDERLELFKKLYEKINKEVSNPIPLFTKVLKELGTSPFIRAYNNSNYYENLNMELEQNIKKGNLQDEDIEKLLFLFTSDTRWSVQTFDDLKTFGQEGSKDMIEIEQMVDDERNSTVKNEDKIKEALLWKSYGVSLRKAKSIVSQYRVGNIKQTPENERIIRFIQKSLFYNHRKRCR